MTFLEVENRIYFLTRTSSTSYTDADKNLSVNRAIERVVSLINNHDLKWQYDDSNYSKLPSATTATASGQQDYLLNQTYTTVDRIEVKDTSGNWSLLKQIDKTDIGVALPEYLKGGGVPLEYDLFGRSFKLYPEPNYTQSASIRVYFTRSPLLFDYTDDKFTDDTGSSASSPGFNSLFHDLVPLWASYDYSMVNDLRVKDSLFVEIQRKEVELVKFYALRDRGGRKRMTVSTNGRGGSTSGRLGGGFNDSNK